MLIQYYIFYYILATLRNVNTLKNDGSRKIKKLIVYLFDDTQEFTGFKYTHQVF